MSQHRAVRARSIRASWVAAGVALVTALSLSVVVAAPANAATVTANDAAHLATYLADNTNDTVVLGASIAISDGSNLTVSTTLAKTLDLNGQNLTISGVGANLAGIDVSGSASLTIVNNGSGGQLTVTGGADAAGIGGGNGDSAGTVSVSGPASVTATGTGGGAGIGGGKGGGAGTITISHGSVNATGGTDGAGIGTGQGGSAGGASVTISGGTVSASGASGGGAGIGGGNGGAGFTVNISGGHTTATGGSGGGAGIGGGNGHDGGDLNISGITQIVQPSSDSDIIAAGGGGGAGIGGGSGGNGGGTVTMLGTSVPDPDQVHHAGHFIIVGQLVSATGGSGGGAGVGGGNGGNGGSVDVQGGSLVSTGAGGGAGVGGGASGAGGSVSTSQGAGIVAQDGGGTSSAVGAGSGGTGFGTMNNSGGVTIPSGSTLRIPSGATAYNPGAVVNNGTITVGPSSAGTLVNSGTILNSGTIENNGDGGTGHLTVSINNFVVTYDINGGTGTTPASQRVYAPSLSVAGLSLPAPGAGTFQPPAGAAFYAWYSASNAVVSTLTDLASTFGNGPRTVPLHAHYRLPQTITFDPASVPTQTFGSNPVPLTISATSGLPVTVNAGPSNVCTYSGGQVAIVGAGACGISASQGGNTADWLAAPNVSISFQVITGTLVIPVVGTQTYGGYPSFTTAPGFNPPNGVIVQGSISCTALTGGSITSTLHPGSYQIDSNSCGGIGLDGTNAPNYHIAYSAAPGSFTVNPAQITVSALGVQPYGGTPTFMPAVTLPPNVQLTGTLTCTALESGPISTSLPIGSGYTTKGSTCSGLGLTGSEAFGYTIAYADGQFVVSPAPVTVTATGTQAFGASPAFTPVDTPPSGVTVSGTLSCTGLTGNIPITPSLSVGGQFTIDHATCSGLSLSGPNASNCQVSYADGPFTVTKAHVGIVTHTNSFTNQNSVHKVIWTTTVTNADAHTILAGIQVTITVKAGTATITCKATTDSTGTATCSSGLGSLFLPPRNRTYTATTAETSQLFAGSATGTIGS